LTTRVLETDEPRPGETVRMQSVRSLLRLAAFSAVVTGGSAWLIQASGTPIAWPVVGLMMAWLGVGRKANAAAPTLICGLSGTGSLLVFGWSASAAVAMMAFSIGEAYCALALYKRLRPNKADWLDTVDGFFTLLATIALIATVFAIPATAIAAPVLFETTLQSWLGWAVASFLGTLIVIPLALMVRSGSFKQDWLRLEHFQQQGLNLALLAVAVMTLAVFSQETLPLLFLPLFPIVITAFKSDKIGVTVSTLLLSSIAIVATAFGYGPIAHYANSPFVEHLLLQTYIAVSFIMSIPVAIELQERKLNSARLAQIMESTYDCVCCLDLKLHLTYLNRRAVNEISRGADLRGQHILDAFPLIEDTPLWVAYREVLDGKGPRQLECFVEDLNHWYEVHIVPEDDCITVFFRNIDDRKAAEDDARYREEKLKRTLAHVPQMIWATRPDGFHDYYSPLWYEFTGVPPGSTDGDGWSEMFHPNDRDRAWSAWQHSLKTGEPYEIEYRLRHHSGEYRWVLGRANPERNRQGEIVRWYGTCTDIHEGVLAKQAWHETRTVQEGILDSSADCIKLISADGTIEFMNEPGIRSMELESIEIVLGKPWVSLWPAESQSDVQAAIEVARSGSVSRFSGFCPTASGKPRWWDVVVSPVRNARGEIDRLLSISRDITEQRETAQKLRRASEEDALTNLPNRRAFESHLRAATIRAMQSAGQVTVLLVDVDHFKHVNDTFGHPAGDRVLTVFAQRLKNAARSTDFVARLGGDEFAVILESPDRKIDPRQIGDDMVNRLRRPIRFEGHTISAGASIGGAVFPDNSSNANELLKNADIALYALKEGGRGGTLMFQRDMLEHAQLVASQLSLARAELNEVSIEPHYQPKVDLKSGRIAGLEALLRWRDGTRGLQMPDTIAEAFKDYELAARIGEIMQNSVFRDARGWLDCNLPVGFIAINAAPAEFLRDDFAEKFIARMRKYSIPPALVEVEITEHVFSQRGGDYVGRALELLKKAGVRIALDDFGTGHSSLSHLRDYPVDVLKIDRSFVERMETDDEARAIVSAVIKLAKSLKIDVVAEGLETQMQKQMLLHEGCKIGQGFFFGRAMQASDVPSLYQNFVEEAAA
jgi:diguanylate cyclase (GGDEF)-like protein/PAS domain S-box-containing protein